ncbi:MAG: SIS domain-containing protein [Verrucomicrobia bacterium]|nr:SIS domain-containing protein [Verrucomicrobiota bacterium]
MRNDIENAVADVIRSAEYLKKPSSLEFIETASGWIADCFQADGKILVAGNGGSLCDAMHFAEELTGQFRGRRKALPALALSDPGHLTCVSNDMGFDAVFSRGVEAFGRPGDILILLTTSGNSQNIYNAALSAREKGLRTIAFLGKSGGQLRGKCDLEWVVSGFEYSDRIQEAHMAAIHIIIEMVEKKLFLSPSRQELAPANC